MSDKHLLRQTRASTVINNISRQQEKEVSLALSIMSAKLSQKFPKIVLRHRKEILLKDVVHHLRKHFSDVDFSYHFESSSMKPDGGLLNIQDRGGELYPVLITEVKNQGTNDLRLGEGKKKQAQGNAIERLGKNVIGFRTYLLTENIFPFVCFGYGCDFEENCSILDRVTTIAMFGELNRTHLHNQSAFNRGSFYFKPQKWSVQEMADIMYDIAEKSIYYYYSKYGKKQFEVDGE